METICPARLATLGHPQRLALFRLLMRRYPDHVAARDLATALGLKPSTLSAYLGALMAAGLIRRNRVGTSLRYAIDMAGVQDTFDYLLSDCARGRADPVRRRTAPHHIGDMAMADHTQNVLFICTGNSARSIFAETLLRDLGAGRFEVHSAGTRPHSALNPFALDILRQNGHDTAPLRAKHIAEFQGAAAPVFDFVFTVCDRAADEDCPAWPGQPISGHWGLPDPVKATGSDAEKSLAFHQTYSALRRRIIAFAALPVETLDRLTLQNAIDDLSRDKDTDK